jgi:hypothetical protein
MYLMKNSTAIEIEEGSLHHICHNRMCTVLCSGGFDEERNSRQSKIKESKEEYNTKFNIIQQPMCLLDQ